MIQFIHQGVVFNYPAIKKVNKKEFSQKFGDRFIKGTIGKVYDKIQVNIKNHEAKIKAEKDSVKKAESDKKANTKKINEGFERRREKHAAKPKK